MNKEKILSVCCLTVCFVFCFGSFAVAEKPLPVEVQNTVPVTGDVSIANTSANPVPVKVVYPSAKQIFRYAEFFNGEHNLASFQVAGPKRLVIEFASLNAQVIPPNDAPDTTEDWGIAVIFDVFNSESTFQYILPNISAGKGVFGYHRRHGALPIKIYAEPGDFVSIRCIYAGPGVFSGNIGLSGYYEEVPAP